ncbi:GTPase-associated protein 1-related protein [Streptomyces sp. G45]|uniref:GTPase-associated protein 1-related protein n=1 Tax=Streptomyces sp. G45 TaxID=3406627 RepID=UPI003C2368E2
MAIRRLTYRLDEEPVTGAVRLIPVPPPEGSAPAPDPAPEPAAPPGDPRQALDRQEWVALAVGAEYGPGGDGGGISFSRLPDGGGLLCATARAGRAVEALHVSGPDTGRFAEDWPITQWEPDGPPARRRADGEPAEPEDWYGPAALAAFARAHEPRVAPFLADVRRLFADPAGRQLVIAEESQDTVAQWIALACASLPAAYVPYLTFTLRAADPGRAPQHIVGIGPDADFDRFDPTVLDHLYRVHDGLDGHGSPPLADTWAAWTARLWVAGKPPRPARDAAEEPFALGPLVPRLLRAGLLTGADLAHLARQDGPDGPQLRAAVDALVAALDDGTADPGTLTAVCRDLHVHAPTAAQPLALAVARHRLAAVHPDDRAHQLRAAFAELPLGDDGRRALRGEFGGDAVDELCRALSAPLATWGEPLRRALDAGADGEDCVSVAAVRLAAYLRDPTGTGCGQAVAVLEQVGQERFTRRVLKQLCAKLSAKRLDQLKELAASPQGDWLRRNLDARSPLPLRLADAAVRWGGPGGATGYALFSRITEELPGRRVTDPATLSQVWWFVWGGRGPGPVDLPRVARACTMRLLVDADFGARMTGLLTAPDRVDKELVSFAHELLRVRKLGPRERAIAELLVLADDMAERRVPLARGIGRFQALREAAHPVPVQVWSGVNQFLALALARSDAQTLRHTAFPVMRSAGRELLDPYRACMLSESKRDELARELPLRPEEIGAYYYLWRPRRSGDVSHHWRRVSEELLREILAPVVLGLSPQQLDDATTAVARGHNVGDVQKWNDWRHGLREG